MSDTGGQTPAAPAIHPSRLAFLTNLSTSVSDAPTSAVAPSAVAAAAPSQTAESTAEHKPERRASASRDEKKSDHSRRSRDRGDREERSKSRRSRDRGDRGSRSHRDRDRDRDRDRGSRRDRDRSRDRSSRRDRDRGSRERRRDRDGNRDRDRNDRRDRGSRRDRSRSGSRGRGRDGPLAVRKTKSRFWDVCPPGYESVTPLQFKAMVAAGQIPPTALVSMIPGFGIPFDAPAVLGPNGAVVPGMPMGPLGGMTSLPSNHPAMMGGGDFGAMNSSATRQSRRLYVGNIPYGVSDSDMQTYFNELMVENNLTTAPGLPVISAQVNVEKNFCFLEFRGIEETTNGLAFDGIKYQGSSLKLRRPKDYQVIPGYPSEPPQVHIPGLISTTVPDSINKLFVGGLPIYLSEEQVKELLGAFGELRAFNLVKDVGSETSKGFAFLEYVDTSNTDRAIHGLHGMQVADKQLVVQRASAGKSGTMPQVDVASGALPASLLAATQNHENISTEVLVLLNMVTTEDLADDEEYEDIVEDIREECAKFGAVKDMRIPRPKEGVTVIGLGKVFVRFEEIAGAEAAQQALAGRKFGGQTVVTSYTTVTNFENSDFS
ncbi:hypothetical protein SARC_04157 [Sphaeroforma arctica JP610]|uniref:RRM domain-containing protein n=1 Tax=Sphaeroforma arctica JP610 TaxID=667725 RepID=A0A0L0G422_9EUKA|nr:hypothetical protein SARC_04157 [Sphaeroforma arctica JP610]KNC83599.1 hypothetical protein SARC_04157 [Sphaeroforma arctica JP610]|eukprot:XP_014157501.1 hypothetical protein SARC_04157 [Sphaeroforma arctica JP610]